MTALSHELLARLEAAVAGRLSEEETQKLDAELAQVPEGTAAAADYRKIWAGLAALRSEVHQSKMKDWEAAWQAVDDAELVEWYLENKLSDGNRLAVEQRLANDQAFANLLKEQKALRAGFESLRDEQFRTQIRQWGQEARMNPDTRASIRPMKMVWRRVAAVAAAVLFFLAIGVAWNMRMSFSDQALADKYYKIPPTGNTMGAEITTEQDYLQAFAEAHQAMQMKDYAAARLLFEDLATQVPPANFSSDDLSYYQDNLDWNLVLALLGQEESGAPLQQRLDVILSSPDHTYFKEAQNLNADLDNFWR